MAKFLHAILIFASFSIMSQSIAKGLSDKDKLDWTLTDAYKVQTETREKISLNGVWKISLQTGKDLFKRKKLSRREQMLEILHGAKKALNPQTTFNKEKNWQQTRVPGLWYDAGWWSATKSESMLGRKKFKRPTIRVCNKVKWLGKTLKNYHFAWYEREFTIPENWTDGQIFLKFNKFNRKGWVFVNSTFVGCQTTNQSETMPLPSTFKAGMKVKLDILISAFVEGDETIFMGGKQIFKVKKVSFTRGIGGDTWLIRRQSNKYIKDVFIETSVRQKKLKLKVKFSKPPHGSITGTIKNWKNGRTVKTFSLALNECKKLSKNEYELTIPWDNPILWNPENPHLYTLNLTWKNGKGGIIDADCPKRFGFREIWIKGKEYYLNGNPVRFRIATGYAMSKDMSIAFFKDMKDLGENSVELLDADVAKTYDIREMLDAADENGIMIFYLLPGVNKLTQTWHDENARKAWIKKLKSSVNAIKNHPSIVQWGMNFNLLGYPLDLEPRRIGKNYYPSKTSSPGVKWKVAKASQDILKKIDPTRPTYHHAGGNYGEAHTSNLYLCFCPLQEKSEWPKIWAKKGVKPFMPIELGTPFENTYYFDRKTKALHCFASEPLYAEFSARVLGPEAFFMADTARMKKILKLPVIKDAMGKKPEIYKGMRAYYYNSLRSKSLDDFINTQCKLGEFIKDWRAYGVNGFNPWYNQYALKDHLKPYTNNVANYKNLKTPGYKTLFEYKPKFTAKTNLYRKYKEWLKPELLYIGGEKNEFTDKSSAFYSGTKIKKSIVWINDTFKQIKSKLRVELVNADSGKKDFEKEFDVKAKPGQIQFLDFSFNAPKVKDKTSCSLKLYKNGKLVDETEIRLFPVMPDEKLSLKRKILLLDTKGYTASLLKKLHIDFTKFNGQSLDANDLLIIGRESLQDVLPYSKAVCNAVRSGMNLIVFEQKRSDLENNFGLRVFDVSARRSFLEKNNGIFKHLDNKDFNNWPGKATLLEEYPEPENNKYPSKLWKFGNRQVVASTVIEKPHKGPYKSLLHQGFDLAYTPLLEETYGKGKIIYCQLDLSGRTTPNPAGDIVCKQLISYVDKSFSNPKDLFYAGTSKDKKLLDSIGIKYQEIDNIKNVPDNAIIVVGDPQSPGSKPILTMTKGDLNKFVNNGGTIVILATNDLRKVAATFGLDIPSKQMNDFKFRHKAIEGITEGLGGGDWYWKDIIKIPLPDDNFPIKIKKRGKGRVVICQVNPFYYNDSQMNQRRERSRAKMTRIISTILSNLGAQFKNNSFATIQEAKGVGDLDLEGKWNFKMDPDNQGLKAGWHKLAWSKADIQLEVPGTWEEQGINTPNPKVDGKLPYDGFAWFQKEVFIPKSYKGKKLYLEIGTADDFDWSYVNGHEIGKTGKEHPKYYDTKRYYPIPSTIIKYGEKNLIALRIFDNHLSGGIPKGPVRITFKKKNKHMPYLDATKDELSLFNPYHYRRW